MPTSIWSRRLVPALGLLAGLAACTGQQQSTAGGFVPSDSGQARPGSHPNHVKSWMKPGVATNKLLYVADGATGSVYVYTYPGLTFAGQLTGFGAPSGECTDRAGNVWIADEGHTSVYEYAHGGTSPINILTSGVIDPVGCAIDRKTGDLAVANGTDEVLVFHNATGAPTEFADGNFSVTEFLSYDNQGNLFVDGADNTNLFHYAELPAGNSTFTDITLSNVPSGIGNVQWDGTYMDVGDAGSNIYRTQGSNVVSTVTLSTTCLAQFYIVPSDKKVIAPDPCSPDADVYAYPAGGSPVKTVTGDLQHPVGAVLSR